MASFSPAPPRRSSRLQSHPSSSNAPRRGAEPPLRKRLTNAIPLIDTHGSGFGTPTRHTRPTSSPMEVLIDPEDIKFYGQRDDSIFVRSEEMSVALYSGLPIEVKQVLKSADVYADAFSGEIDAGTGFALVASANTCFVWQHAQAVRGVPTCYIFSCPPSYLSGGQQEPPFHKLVPYGSNRKREPGLVLLSVSGQVRFWDGIGIGLAGGEHYTSSELKLADEELVTGLIRCDDQTYFASTSAGRIFRLVLISQGGKHHIASHPFAQPPAAPLFGRFSFPSFFSGSNTQAALDPGYITALALGHPPSSQGLTNVGVTPRQAGHHELWALIDTRVQKWDVRPEGWEEPVMDDNVADVIRELMRGTWGRKVVSERDEEVDLELVDLAVSSENKLIVLISYAGLDDPTHASSNDMPAFDASNDMAIDLSGARRMYALVTLEVDMQTINAETIKGVPYQSTSASGAPIHPRIQLVQGGELVSVQFGDAVAFCAKNSDYTDRLALRSPTDRTLAVGVIQNESGLLVLTAGTMMRVDMDMERVGAFDPEQGKANLIMGTMKQAILYGPNVDNPLAFSFPPDIDGESLMNGAQRLSQAILHSDAELVKRNQDLSGQIVARRERLGWLIQFISDNAALPKMSQKSRQRLATDAEKLFACHLLWNQHSQLLATSPEHSILVDTVLAYMNDTDDQYHEDVIRAFFRYRTQEIGKLLGRIYDQVTTASQNLDHDTAGSLSEANSIVLTVLNSALDFRKEHRQLYAISLPMINPWTSKSEIIEMLLGLFDSTKRLLEGASSSDPAAVEPRGQLVPLANLIFVCVTERVEWLASEEDKAGEREQLESRFASLRPEILETLRKLGFANEAFHLAERYHDFGSLVALCHKEAVVYPPEENPHAVRIEGYLERFKYAFAKELYSWCVQHGELRIMFAEPADSSTIGVEGYTAFKDWYLAKHPSIKPSIVWANDLENRRYEKTAGTLLKESKEVGNLDVKHFMLSLGKLSHLVQISESGGEAARPSEADQGVLDEFHDDLDFVSVHERLIAEFEECCTTSKSRKSTDAKIAAVLKAKASRLERSGSKALIGIFKSLSKELLAAKVLSVEDTVDLLTLKDNEDTLENFTIALQLLAGAKNLPESRRTAAFYSAWRRVLSHDDWHAILRTTNVSDAEVSDRLRETALYSALSAVLPSAENAPSGFDLYAPHTCLTSPSTEVIMSRWQGMASDEVEGLQLDYDRECDSVRECGVLSGEEEVWDRVRELARRDFDEEMEMEE